MTLYKFLFNSFKLNILIFKKFKYINRNVLNNTIDVNFFMNKSMLFHLKFFTIKFLFFNFHSTIFF